MPQHRVAVRDKVAEILAAALPDIPVHRARSWAVGEAEMPALFVYGWQEVRKRTGGTSYRSFYTVTLTLAVEIRLDMRSRDGVALEAELEAVTGTVTDAVLEAGALLLPPDRLIERVEEVKTTLGIDTKSSELALGAALVAFDMAWTEVSEVPSPEVDCGADSTSIRFRPV